MGSLYSLAMVIRFYTVGVRRKGMCCRGLVIITCDGGGAFCWEIVFKILVGLGGAFSNKGLSYLQSYF